MDILKNFGIEPILLLAQIVNFTVLLLLLKKFLYQPIIKLLEERKNKIAKTEKMAAEMEEKFAQLDLVQKEITDKAKKEAEAIIRQAKEEAHLLAEEIHKEAEKTAQAIHLKNQQLLKAERDKMMAEVKEYLVDLVIATSEKALSRTLSENEKKAFNKLVMEELKN